VSNKTAEAYWRSGFNGGGCWCSCSCWCNCSCC